MDSIPELAVIVMCCNEDNVLGRCLESCSGLELHVSIDNKTTDASADVAIAHGATLYKHEFANNSWADTRNAVMAEVEATSAADWFLWLDADEWLLGGRELLPHALAAAEQHEVRGIAVTMQDHREADDGTTLLPGRWPNVKVLRRGVRYERRRHEAVPAETPRVQAEQIVIGHRKSQRPEVIAANEDLKGDLSALVADWEQYRDRRSAYYLADRYYRAGEYWTAVQWYQTGLRTHSPQVGMEALLRDGAAQCYRLLGQVEDAREMARGKLLSTAEDFAEACFDVGCDSHNLGDVQQAQFYLKMAIAAAQYSPPRLGGIGHPEKSGQLAYFVLALSEFTQGRLKESAAWLAKAESLGPDPRHRALWERILQEGAKEFASVPEQPTESEQEPEEVTADAVVCGGGSQYADG